MRRVFSGNASLHMETDLRNDFYAHLQSLQVSFHDNWQSGQLLSRAISDIATVRRFVSFGLIWFLQTIVTFIVVFVLMAQLDSQLALVVFLFMIPIAIFSYTFHNKYKVIARRLQDLTGDMTTTIEEMATGVRIVKAFGRMPLMQKRYEDEARLIRATSLEGIRARAALWSTINFLPNLSLAAVLLLGGLNVVQGRLTIGGLVAFMNYVFMLIWPMDAIGWVLSMSEECQTASQRLNEVLDSHPEIADQPRARPLEHSRGRLEFRGVGFKYPKSDAWILRDLNLVGEQGYTLSGGQRQRLALARAVLGSPPVLVLDDPLSSVDVHTEAVIEAALANVLEGVTGLLVVHRPSTLALADRVALIDGGTVAATGTHTELMRTNALYRALLSQEYEEAMA